MADYAPPSGPPPPHVPEGWKAVWNEQYQEWFYVNLHTKISQWELPTQPAYPSGAGDIHSNNPYGPHAQGAGGAQNTDSDAVYAARLQAEEDERARGVRPVSSGAAAAGQGYYGQQTQQEYSGGMGGHVQPQHPPGYVGGYPGAPGSGQNYDQHELPPREHKGKGLGGLLSKLSGKAAGGSSSSHGHGGFGGGGMVPQQHGYAGGYGGGGYAAPHRKPGLGAGGGLALGAGGGLLGGAMLGSAMAGHHGGGYGGDDGGGYGGDDGGGYGGDDGGGYGGDDGGGYGGDDGGGDFGGGDFGGGDGGGGGGD